MGVVLDEGGGHRPERAMAGAFRPLPLLATSLALPFSVAVAGGYGLGWGWTGYADNTLWDWLQLVLVPFVVPTLFAWLSARVAEVERERHTDGAPGAAREA